MKKLIGKFFFRLMLLWVVIASATALQAHPGIGLVYDGQSTIYYTDLKHVWKMDISTGIAEIFIKDVHTHELALDKEGNLFGEHYWYVESAQKFKNYIWKASPTSEFQKIREEEFGENEDFSFVRDSSFNGFIIRQQSDQFQIVKQQDSDEVTWHTTNLQKPTWKYWSPQQQALLFADYPKIYAATENDLKVVVTDISAKKFPFSSQRDDHNIYGIWTDSQENIYVAIYGGRVIKKIKKNGDIARIWKSSFFWSPVNGVFDKNNNLWLMECRIGGKIRVRKILAEELTEEISFGMNGRVLIASLMTFLLAIFYFRNRFWKVQKVRLQ